MTLADRQAKNAAVLACMDLYVVEVFFKGEWIICESLPQDAEGATALAVKLINGGDRARVVVA